MSVMSEKSGVPVERVLADLESLRSDDVDWRAGRAFSLAYSAGPEVLELSEAAYRAYSGENALNVEAFPSLRRMQSDVVAEVATWLSAPEGHGGFMTSGGTESLILAVWASLQRHRRLGRSESGLNVVLPESAHAALEKACTYFGLESRRVPVGPDWRADVSAMESACDSSTVLMVGSAPQYPQGVIDPIAELAAVAADRDVNLHVDACMGGVVLPCLERTGQVSAPWDFRCEGVTSMSVDLHKYGYTAKGAGVIIHRDRQRRGDQVFVTDNWLGGMYGSSGILGTKSGGSIASAWAVMRHLGVDGYQRLAMSARETTLRIAEHVRAHPRLALVANPDSTLLCIGVIAEADSVTGDGTVDGPTARTLAAGLRERGWYVDLQVRPPAIHLTVNAVHRGVVDDFLADLDFLVATPARSSSGEGPEDGRTPSYGSVD